MIPDSERPLRKGSDDSVDTFTSSESYSQSHFDPRRDRRRGDDRHRRQGTGEDYDHQPDNGRRSRRERERRDKDRGRGRQETHDSGRRDRDRDRDRHRGEDRERRRRISYDREEEEEERERRRRRKERKRRRREREEREHSHGHGREDRSPTLDTSENPFTSPYDEKPTCKAKDRQYSRDPKFSPKRGNPLEDLIIDEEKAAPGPGDRHLTKLERFGGPWIYIIPLLASFCLLAASTCSSDRWRKDVNVIRLGLPGDIYARLLATGSNLGKGGGGGDEVIDSGGRVRVGARAAKISPQGWLSVGFWGWCVGPEGDGPWACSKTDAWFNMDELLETAAVTNTIPTDAYFVGLMHGIVVHGLAMVATMSATVPAGILIWRRYIRNNKTISPGLALHATIFAGSAFSFIAFVIDKALEARVRDQTKYPVEQGSVPIMAGVSALLLFLAFLVSIAPGIHRRVKRQKEYAGSWEDVIIAATELERPVSASTTATGLTRSKTWGRMKRMTTFKGRGRRDGR